MPRVLHVIPSVSKTHGGPSRAIVAMERELAQRGVQVTTLTTDDDGPGKRLPVAQQLNWGGGGAQRIYVRKRSEFYKFAPGIIGWLRAHLGEYDVVHIHALFSFTSVVAGWLSRQRGVPYIIRPLGTLTHYGVNKRRPWLKRLSLVFIEGPLIRNAAVVHFTSAAEANEAAELGITLRRIVIPLGITPDAKGDARLIQRLLPEPNGQAVLLYLSRLDHKKNVEGFLRACALLKGRNYEFNVLMAGGGDADYVAKLKTLAATEGLGDRIVWLGPVEGETKAAALAAADLFVLPSFSENFGIAAVEALFAGLPCVLGEGVAIAQEVAEAGAGVVVKPTPEAIASGIAQLFEDPEARDKMGSRAADFASSEYSAATMGERLEALYRDIIASNAAKRP